MLETAAMDDARGERLIGELESAHPGFRSWPNSSQEGLLDLYRYQVGADPVLVEMGTDLIKIAMFPLGAWGFRSVEELDDDERLTYFGAILKALSVAARSHLEGNRVGEYPDSPLPRLRRFLDGHDPDPKDEERRRYQDRQFLMDNLAKPAEQEVPSY